MGWRGRSGARSSEVGAEEECEQGSARGRGSTRAAGWGSRWAASGRLPGSSSRSRAGSGAAAQPGPRAAGGTRRGVPQTPASTSSPSTVSVSGAGGGREGGAGDGVGSGRGARRTGSPRGARAGGVPASGGGICCHLGQSREARHTPPPARLGSPAWLAASGGGGGRESKQGS